MSARDEAKAKTREKVVRAAKLEFDTFSYDHVTIRSVAVQAGVSTGSIFMFVDTKEQLFEMAMEREAPPIRLQTFLRKLAGAEEAGKPPGEAALLLKDLFGETL